MHEISEHDTKEERERYASENSWVDLFVAWDSISINNLLISKSEGISFEICWFVQSINIVRPFDNIQTS
jgi:hypothetical protein